MTTVAACACGVSEKTLPLRCAYRYCHYASHTPCPTYSLQGPAREGVGKSCDGGHVVVGTLGEATVAAVATLRSGGWSA